MKKNYTALFRAKIFALKEVFRKLYFGFLGMQIGKNVRIGTLNCQWPNRINLGEGTILEDSVVFKITKPFNEENRIIIGKRVFIGMGCEFNCNTKITVGDDCLIASNTTFVDTGHEISKGSKINTQPCIVGEIILEEDVWVGTNCIILKGVTIGKGSIVGAGSLVNRSIPEYQIWAGSPARFIRNRE
jgi:acetyltransferase-like isoleucine patch superfamily enzyme